MKLASIINKENRLLQSSLQSIRMIGTKRRLEYTERLLCKQIDHCNIISDDEEEAGEKKGESLNHLRKRQRHLQERKESDPATSAEDPNCSTFSGVPPVDKESLKNASAGQSMNSVLKALAAMRESRRLGPGAPTEGTEPSSSKSQIKPEIPAIKRDLGPSSSPTTNPSYGGELPSLQISILSYNVWWVTDASV
jgi:hypothetical protein